jgi:hypothetical protein
LNKGFDFLRGETIAADYLQRLSAGEASFDVVPPLKPIALIRFPAKQNDAAIAHRRKID